MIQKLKRVYIHPNVGAKTAETLINNAIEKAGDLAIDYELLVENSVSVGSFSETRYTLIIQESYILIVEGEDEE